MQQAPDFLVSPISFEGEETFRPTLIPLRGGFIAWGAALLIGATTIFLKLQTGQLQCISIGFFLFFLLATVLITFNRWVDANTVIHATESYLSYKSPIKQFLQQWDQIPEIRAMRAGGSWRVLIVGEQSSFSIRIKSSSSPDDHKARVLELPRGDELIRIICGMAKLHEKEQMGDEWVVRRSSYIV